MLFVFGVVALCAGYVGFAFGPQALAPAQIEAKQDNDSDGYGDDAEIFGRRHGA